jgi:hypothetical protein
MPVPGKTVRWQWVCFKLGGAETSIAANWPDLKIKGPQRVQIRCLDLLEAMLAFGWNEVAIEIAQRIGH